ncbi:lysosomal alpha-glucosidase-like isoform X2 [Athalia rosae]|uniref:lysosomal alpha-glucosidase-like isoform X2 n=1 Tax=Athalia rosae TaxID=37344 RepID=UPI0020341611|nr:lysosomal alpha-glucosidase-like isoform X2 [Athalia rosae]
MVSIEIGTHKAKSVHNIQGSNVCENGRLSPAGNPVQPESEKNTYSRTRPMVGRFYIILFVIIVTLQIVYISQAIASSVEILQEILDKPEAHQTGELETNEITRDISCSGTNDCARNCGKIPKGSRFDCHPETGASQLACTDRGCCWDPVEIPNPRRNVNRKRVSLGEPPCYYPEDWPSYEFVNSTKSGNNFSGFLVRKIKSFYENDLDLIKMETTSLSDDILRVKIHDPENSRYEPPWPLKSNWADFRPKNSVPKYTFEADVLRCGFRVKRVADNVTLFDSVAKGGFIFADQFLQIHSTLPSHNIYGLGEHRAPLKLGTGWRSFTMFNKDQPPTEQANLYSSHPFYFMIEDSGNCHGVLFLNSNAMDVILQPTPAITFRMIGGIFDIYFFMGPTPADVLRQYSEIVGKPFFPPYWSLGFHLCQLGYGSVANTREVWHRTRDAGIPFDTQWNDIDYMDRRNDFTLDKTNYKDLPEFVREIHSVGMHYIPILDAGIGASEKKGTYPAYDEGIRDDIFVKDGITNEPFAGKVWNPVSTVWPDFTHPKSPDYYRRMLQNMHTVFQFDGIWIDMNEPSNFYNGHSTGCLYNKLDNPQYVPNVVGGSLATKTLCMNAQHYLGPHYDLHNTYGIGQAAATNSALSRIRNKRPFVILRATWVGSGYYSGSWTGDVYSSWHDLRMSVAEILSHSFFQVPMVGADICGFDGNTTVALCNRWVQLGAFYPFSRNHNSDDTIVQDPVSMGELVVNSAKRALTIRYKFLPYLYTLFFKAHKFGDTVARPLFFEFIHDKNTYGIDTQFLWGSSLMIVPVLEEVRTSSK